MKTTNTVSVIGLGMMGSTLARLLLSKGYQVTVWNRSAGKVQDLVKAGAVAAADPAAAVAASSIIVICVHDYKATKDILENAAVEQQLKDKLVMQMTTIAPEEARDSEAWAHAHGAAYLNGAIQAAPEQMGQPDTPILVSGAAAAYQRATPVLEIFGGGISYLGERISAAATTDLATLSYVYGSILGFFHGARIMESEGLDVANYGRVVNGISSTFGQFLQHEGEKVQEGDFSITQSPLSISVEAINRILQHARNSRISTAFPGFAAGLFAEAADAGYREEELAAMIKVLRQHK